MKVNPWSGIGGRPRPSQLEVRPSLLKVVVRKYHPNMKSLIDLTAKTTSSLDVTSGCVSLNEPRAAAND
jgi:hypothetical protein